MAVDPGPPPEPPLSPALPRPTLERRLIAAIEVLLCSDYPTQLLLGATFAVLGYGAENADGSLNLRFVVALSMLDTALLIALMLMFLRAHDEDPIALFFGHRPVLQELRAGIPITVVAFLIAVVVLVGVRAVAPWLHTVERNPLQEILQTPGDAVLFAIVAVIAGGVREELQRAFLLHRFEHWLGGRTTGIVVASAAFGAGHLLQGADAAIATGVLGAFWGIVYLRRRSVVAPMVSHSGFNLLQLAQFMVIGR